MSDEALFVDTEEVFAVVAELRRTASAPGAAPSVEPPDVGHPVLADVLWRLSFLARGMPGVVDEQVGYIGDALMQGAIDTEAADTIGVVETATGTTTPTSTPAAAVEPPSQATVEVATPTATPPTATTTATTTTTVPGQD